MRELPKNIKKDIDDLLYLDIDNINLTPLIFDELKKFDCNYSKFYTIDGNKDYILKYTPYPIILRKTRTLNMLRNMYYYQDNIKKVEFPIGYYQKDNKFEGTIIPFYEKAISIRKFIYNSSLLDLFKYYNHDSDEITNLISLYLDILDILKELYDENIVYLDIIHGGNILLYKNEVKLIDYEPGYIKFTDNPNHYYKRIMEGYSNLINYINYKLNIKNVLFYSDDNFNKTKDNIKRLEKDIRGKYGI